MKRGSSLRFIATPTACPAVDSVLISCLVRRLAGADWFAHLLGSLLHGLDDVLIAGAAAQVARQALANGRLAGIWVLLEQRVRRQHHARRAVPALKTVLIPEALLKRVKCPAVGEPLDSHDLVAVSLHRKHR